MRCDAICYSVQCRLREALRGGRVESLQDAVVDGSQVSPTSSSCASAGRIFFAVTSDRNDWLQYVHKDIATQSCRERASDGNCKILALGDVVTLRTSSRPVLSLDYGE